MDKTMKIFKQVKYSFIAAMMLATMPLIASQEIQTIQATQEVAQYKKLNPGQEIDPEIKEDKVTHGAGHKTTHNGSNHVYVGTTLFGDQIEMEDGSFWMTNPEDRA